MDALALARLQFALTTVYHFFFVPLTLGLSILVAIMETLYVRTGNETYKQMTKFWGKLFLINFAVGVVTGIVQEFQFGMNWSQYSRFVGDIFGAPLAIEALMAFFLESTFIAVWFFGWDKLGKRAHLAVDLAGGDCLQSLGSVDFDRQLVHAGAGGLRHSKWPRRNDRFHGADHQSQRVGAVAARVLRRPGHGGDSSCWASARGICGARPTPISLPAPSRLAAVAAVIGAIFVIFVGHCASAAHGADAADEDGLGGSVVQHRAAGVVLAADHRRSAGQGSLCHSHSRHS